MVDITHNGNEIKSNFVQVIHITLVVLFLFPDSAAHDKRERVTPYWKREVVGGADATQLLLDLIKQTRFLEVLNSENKNDHVWEAIADELALLGAPVPRSTRTEAAMKCRNRWNFLHHKYIKYKLREGWMKPPKYFEEVDEVMSFKVTGESLFVVALFEIFSKNIL